MPNSCVGVEVSGRFGSSAILSFGSRLDDSGLISAVGCGNRIFSSEWETEVERSFFGRPSMPITKFSMLLLILEWEKSGFGGAGGSSWVAGGECRAE